VRLILVLLIALEMHIWPDIFVFQPEEYERLIGSEAGCGKFESPCSWPAFMLDQVPALALAILSAAAMLWRGLPKRELVLGALVVTFCGYYAWRAYSVRVEAEMRGYCCVAQQDSIEA